jgi:hypothetical protein
VSAPKARFLGCSPNADRRRGSRSSDRGGPRPKLAWKIDQFVLASPFRSWSLATIKRHFAQARKAAPAGGPNGTKSGGSITPKSGGPIQTKSGGSNHPKSCTDSDSPTDRPDSILCEFEGTIDHVIRRAIAKISFNYLAYFQGAAFLHRSEFDMARQYIRYGTMPDYQMMSIDEVAILEGEPLEGLRVLSHIITTAWTSVNSAKARVSLFNWMTYRISLSKEFEAPDQEIRRGPHFRSRQPQDL